MIMAFIIMPMKDNMPQMITNPVCYHLGHGVSFMGIMIIAMGIITHFTGDFVLPALAWCALGIPTSVVGGIFISCGLTKP